ncbi:integrator complex subunit 7 [Trichogramma pretiosum]|uniref:integrator complex subunit 7 n=1 Tax=Trichogramma pretiosum TaxID=7493 RepID=UPI0006C9D294|nr:integrator complex subunit 7 [Trichogramma pretiosum]
MIRMAGSNELFYGEPEQDANSALMELDKGLRSTKIGEQCEAIVRFPRLFEKYPFPILINSSLLKLADVFRVGSNFLRVWVLRVCQQTDKHLDKILNVDEFVKRIYSVMHSNDPVAKALTLRTLGSVARIIPERKHVHHSIRRAMDCHDLVQVEAAIYAAQMFAAQSKQFAIFMCSKISDMIKGQSTPASMKLQLIPILQYMHHDISTASMANELCLELLQSYPAAEFVKVTLSASTTLASATLINVSAQVTLLIKYLVEDPRLSIKTHALSLLHTLAKNGAHLWPQAAVAQLIDNTDKLLKNNSTNKYLLIKSLQVIEVLSESPVICESNMDEGNALVILCSNACYSPNPIIAVKAVTILARLACYCYEENLPVYCIQDLVASLESLVTLLSLDDKYLYQLKVCLKMIVKLCQAQHSHCSNFVDAICSTLMNTSDSDKQSSNQEVALCEALGAIGGLKEDILLPLLPEILNKLQHTSHEHTKVMLCTLLFQLVAGGFDWNAECLEVIDMTVKSVNDWNKYRIARNATRYGHHRIAMQLFKILKETVASEQHHFWLLGLELMSSAENYLIDDSLNAGKNATIAKLNGAISLYSSACASFKAAGTHQQNLQFACDYSKLRGEFLQVLLQLIHNCRALWTAPPFAIASQEALAQGDEYYRCGRASTQLRKSVVELQTLAENYEKLYQTAFDADPGSLSNLKANQELCLLLAQSVHGICGGPAPPTVDSMFNFGNTIELRQFSRCCFQLSDLAPSVNGSSASCGATQMDLLRTANIVEQIGVLTSGKLRLPIPRFFYQTIQSTSIKLSVAPQPKVVNEPLSVPQGSQLALKVEGVLRHGKRASLYRSVAAIVVSITAATQIKSSSEPKEQIITQLEQTVVPHRDFFACEFLLSLAQPNACSLTVNNGGNYNVTTTTNIVDESGNVWKSGPQSVLQVRVQDEPSRKKFV